MFEREDYIQHLIEEFGAAVRKLLSKQEAFDYRDLEAQLASLCWHHAHLAYPLVLELTEKDLLEALRVAEKVRPYRYSILGDLLSLDGLALEKEGKRWDAMHRRRRALMLYVAGMRVAEKAELWELRRKAEGLIEVIGDLRLTEDARCLFDAHWAERSAYFGLPREVLAEVRGTSESSEFLST
ncbi:MAG: hypothetical protein HY291_19055 [Planctomycetes bacterium]|nr:hypothetical protein [Planctomycetota bacterium]